MQIAVLYPRLTALDAVGPYEVLRLLPEAEVRFVGAAPGPVVADSGVLFLGVTHSYAETPNPDIALVPGSGPRTPATTSWMVQPGLAAMGAKARRGERIVHAGKVATAAGGCHPSKASKTVVTKARTLGRRIALNRSEGRAVPTIVSERVLNEFRKRREST